MAKTKNYIEPAVFFDEVLACQKTGVISETLGKYFLKLAEKYANHRYFVRYHHIKPDIISVAAMACCKAAMAFSPLKSGETWDKVTPIKYNYKTCNNPFAFFTKCCENAIIQFIMSEYNQKNIKNKMLITHGYEADYGYVDMHQNSDGDDDYSETYNNQEEINENAVELEDSSETNQQEENNTIKW